ncbi:origin recognition complex subunit 5 C-terminus-domain-containing protein [Apiosordaria backusii]|uniref:Origin recognition complex subunit 5 C-terminus-domain-containing protein n=1 Tax=Apiosordaria backusii TaxID=314023 RepID=A0AA40ELW4_9PEZI|nr:origin recognition complex subunit 5 C-terminus-domain-containing protein [Apiosordaria backusii]
MTVPIFELPDELRLTLLAKEFPCREPQIRALATLLNPSAAPCRNLVVYGTEATGKTAIITALLASLDNASLRHTIVNSIECITARHLYETVVGKVAAALEWEAVPPRCESVSQLTVELSKMLKYTERPDGFRTSKTIRDHPLPHHPLHRHLPTPQQPPHHLRPPPPLPNLHQTRIHLHPLPNPPPAIPNTTPQETLDLWSRFVGAVHDSLSRSASRSLPSLTQACSTLWPKFILPITQRTHTAKEFSKLVVLARVHFQDESLLDPTLSLSPPPPSSTTTTTINIPTAKPANKTTDLATLLPTTARFLLLSAYLASHNPTKTDLTLFSTFHHGRKRRRGGFSGMTGVTGGGRGGSRKNGSQHRKIARKLLGAHAFVLERMLAIFAAVRAEWDPGCRAKIRNGMVVNNKGEGDGNGVDNDIYMSIATLASLRLLVKVGGGGDVCDLGGKWRVACSWEVVRGLGRSVGVEVEEWLVE